MIGRGLWWAGHEYCSLVAAIGLLIWYGVCFILTLGCGREQMREALLTLWKDPKDV